MKFYVLRLVDWLPNAVRQTNQPKHIIVIYTISGIKAILQDPSVKIADNEGVNPSLSVITRVSCNML
jgi:hypothetical protein